MSVQTSAKSREQTPKRREPRRSSLPPSARGGPGWRCRRCQPQLPCPRRPCHASAAAGSPGFWRTWGPARRNSLEFALCVGAESLRCCDPDSAATRTGRAAEFSHSFGYSPSLWLPTEQIDFHNKNSDLQDCSVLLEPCMIPRPCYTHPFDVSSTSCHFSSARLHPRRAVPCPGEPVSPLCPFCPISVPCTLLSLGSLTWTPARSPVPRLEGQVST